MYVCLVFAIKQHIKKLTMENFYNYLQVNKYSSKSVYPFMLKFYVQTNRVWELRFELFETITDAKDFYNTYDVPYKLKEQNN